MKKFIILISILISSLLMTTTASAISDYILDYDGMTVEYTGSIYKLMINGEFVETTVPPIIFNDYALVPIREVCEPMGALVNYINVSKQIFVNFDDSYLRLKIGSKVASVDEVDVDIPGDIAPMLISINGSDAKTMVPVRFMAENLGFDVQFDGENGIIKITEPEEVEKSVINNFRTSLSGTVSTVKITFDKPISQHTKPALTNSDVLYFDIADCAYDLPSTNEINKGGIKTLRFGIHDNSTRVALDLENYTGYKATLSNDKKTFTITVTSRPIENIKPNDRNEIADKTDEDETQDEIKIPQTAFEKIVVIDAGHGGKDPGTSGTLDEEKFLEKDINLIVAKKVKKILENKGISVIMTRDTDIFLELPDRSDIANINDAVMFVSIHANWATSETASGYEVYYSKMNNSSATGISSKELADSIFESLGDNVSTRPRSVKYADHVVTKTSYMPAVLIEIGFMSNAEELELMFTKEFQEDFSNGVAQGILNVIDDAMIPSECGIIYEEMKAAEAKKEAEKTEKITEETKDTTEELTEETESDEQE